METGKKFGKNVECGNILNFWKFEKKIEIWKYLGNLEIVGKFGKNLDIWNMKMFKKNWKYEKVGNLEGKKKDLEI